MEEHIPVLLEEVIRYLDPKPNKNFIDCTLGGGGHAEKILEKTKPRGKLLGIDLDQKAISIAKKRLAGYKPRCIFVQNNFINLKQIINEYNFYPISGILFDLGISLYQLQDQERGFSYQREGQLDMRFGPEFFQTSAQEIINKWDAGSLEKIFKQYGEVKQAKRIVQKIVRQRKERKIETTKQLKEIILKLLPERIKKEPLLSKVFQALRIAVNNELKNLSKALSEAIDCLEEKGRIVCISYHSLEDRIIKHIFQRESKDCLCPPEILSCQCNHKAKIKIITKKPILPTVKELSRNPRCRSAKLRAAERL